MLLMLVTESLILQPLDQEILAPVMTLKLAMGPPQEEVGGHLKSVVVE